MDAKTTTKALNFDCIVPNNKNLESLKNWSDCEVAIAEYLRRICDIFTATKNDKPFSKISPSYFDHKANGKAKFKQAKISAANCRGLYLKNGRSSHITIHKPAEINFDPIIHAEINSAYMNCLCHKYQSINHLFLDSSNLSSLEIVYSENTDSTIALDDVTVSGVKRHHARISIGNDIANPLWKKSTKHITNLFKVIPTIRDTNAGLALIVREALTNFHEDTMKSFDKSLLRLLRLPFFEQWQDELINHLAYSQKGTWQNDIAHIILWLKAFAWLSIYAIDNYAGRRISTVRTQFPFFSEKQENNILHKYSHIYPDSSLSVTFNDELNVDGIEPWRNINEQCIASIKKSNNSCIKEFYNTCEIQFYNYITSRMETGSHYSSFYDLYTKVVNNVISNIYNGENEIIAEDSGSTVKEKRHLPQSASGILFMLQVANNLIGLRHEGMPLHFSLIFSFSWERISHAAGGMMKQLIGGLREEWEDYIKLAISGGEEKSSIKSAQKAMYKWIKNSDLPMQDWETAMIFEESCDQPWPIPTCLAKLSCGPGATTISNEYHLRKALRELTMQSKSTCAILVVQSGIVFYCYGRAVLISNMNEESIQDSIGKIRLYGTSRLTDIEYLELSLEDMLKEFKYYKDISESENEETKTAHRKQIASDIVSLCEALSCSGHGGLLVLRAPNMNSQLPPLNPMWTVNPGYNAPQMNRHSIHLYSMLAALDGATEIVLPKNGDNYELGLRKSISGKITRNGEEGNYIDAIWEKDSEGKTKLKKDIVNVDCIELIGKGSRHHSALALSQADPNLIIITVSADGPITFWYNGGIYVSHRLRAAGNPKLRLRP